MSSREAARRRRVWDTIYPPKRRTLLMMLAYGCLLADWASMVAVPGSPPPHIVFFGTLLFLGAVVGIPTAWAGWWAMEEAAASIAMVGLFGISIDDLFRVLGDMSTARFPGHSLALTVFGLFMLAQRAMTIHGKPWAPGKGPRLGYRIAAEQEEAAARELAQVIRERQEAGTWTTGED